MSKQIHILLVEDNEGDVILTKEALKQVRLDNSISVAKNGEEALQYLRKEGGFAHALTPDLVLLDINLPKINGKEVLATIKSDEGLCIIPVVMLTTSSAEQDILESYQHHANCYITKPVDLKKFIEAIEALKAFWMKTVQLPTLLHY